MKNYTSVAEGLMVERAFYNVQQSEINHCEIMMNFDKKTITELRIAVLPPSRENEVIPGWIVDIDQAYFIMFF
jgi:hypothetical protein